MFNTINNLLCKTTDNIVFYQNEKPIFLSQWIKDIAVYANEFCKITNKSVILYIPDNKYLFYVCFIALLEANKDIILPAKLLGDNTQTLLSKTNTVVTNVSCPNTFKCVPLEPIIKNTPWNFKDTYDNTIYFFTSGSTGIPKCIPKSINTILQEAKYLYSKRESILQQLPIFIASIASYHMYGLIWDFFLPIQSSTPVDLDIIFTPEELQHKQHIYDKIVFATTPSFLNEITKYPDQYEFKNNCIEIISSGSLLSNTTSNNTKNILGISPLEIFGSTETGGVAYRRQQNGEIWTLYDDVNTSLNETNNTIIINSKFSYINPYNMSDIVQYITPRQFILQGRADRMVKIAEERVSLPEMEEYLEKYALVEKAYVTSVTKSNRLVLATLLTLTDMGKIELINIGKKAFVQSLKQYLSTNFSTIVLPKKYCIVNNIPTNSQGKFIKSEISNILTSNVQEPVIQDLIKTESSVSMNLTFLKDSNYFKGHFPEHPILPGVIQLMFIIYFIQNYFRIHIKHYNVYKLKFSNLILPDTSIQCSIIRNSQTEFTFTLTKNDTTYTSGKIILTTDN